MELKVVKGGVEAGTLEDVEFIFGYRHPLRTAVRVAILEHAPSTIGMKLHREWCETPGDVAFIPYAREHWDELVPLIVKERLK